LSQAQSRKLERYLSSIVLDNEKTALLLNAKKIISFSPHPDDCEIIAGAYLASAVKRGVDVKLVVVSDDRMSFTSIENKLPMETIVATRKVEELKAVEILGIKDVEFLEHIDSRVPEPSQLMYELIPVIRNYAPDLVITVDPYLPYESHPDHLNTGNAVLRAVLFHRYPYIMQGSQVKSPPPAIALGGTASPNVIVKVDDTIQKKVESVLAHGSQFPDQIEMESRLKTHASKLGALINCRYGEAFRVLMPEEIHLDVFASF
jgi:LmbE family N-acetylglucosaminyl deacetylase